MTVTNFAQVKYPLRPTPEKIKGTLLDWVTPVPGIKWLVTRDHETEEMYDSYRCMKFQHAAAFCDTNDKDFDQDHPWQSGFRFAVYGGAHCKAVGLDMGEFQSQIEEVFTDGESTAVEMALMAQRFAAGPDRDSGAPVDLAWEAPVDVHSAGAVKPIVGLALLESHAAANYVGVPTIHMPRSIATLLLGLGALVWDGDKLRTKLGSKVAAGPGYDYPNSGPDGNDATAGEKWIYASGEVSLQTGDPIIREMFQQSDNEVFVLAERAYVATVDCYTAAVRVTETT